MIDRLGGLLREKVPHLCTKFVRDSFISSGIPGTKTLTTLLICNSLSGLLMIPILGLKARILVVHLRMFSGATAASLTVFLVAFDDLLLPPLRTSGH